MSSVFGYLRLFSVYTALNQLLKGHFNLFFLHCTVL